jgi:hypothetical protein
MAKTVRKEPRIGSVLVDNGHVSASELKSALRDQKETGSRLGELLLARGAVCRPELQRALAHQQGVQLEEEPGFGTGLRAALEQAHRRRRGSLAA